MLINKLYFIFYPHRVDFNKDKSVSAKEMQRWIMEKTEEHFQEAMIENKNSFRAVDPDRDGERRRACVAATCNSKHAVFIPFQACGLGVVLQQCFVN